MEQNRANGAGLGFSRRRSSKGEKKTQERRKERRAAGVGVGEWRECAGTGHQVHTGKWTPA